MFIIFSSVSELILSFQIEVNFETKAFKTILYNCTITLNINFDVKIRQNTLNEIHPGKLCTSTG